jgi:RNA polymerase sigma-70 factor (ECF subfamily)
MNTLSSINQATDDELVKMTQEGNDEAFQELFKRYRPRLSAFSKNICRDDDHAEETCQEAFIRAFQAIKNFKGQSSFSTWLHQIAKNLCWTRKKSISNHPLESLEDSNGAKDTSQNNYWNNQPDQILLSKELGGIIEKAIQNLPRDYRVVLVMKDIEELSNEEIAQSLKLSLAAVKSRLHRARLQIRQEIDHYFLPK